MTEASKFGLPRSGKEGPLVAIGEGALDRMPALTQIFEEASANFTRSLAGYSEMPAALSLIELDAARLGEFAQTQGESRTVQVYHCRGLETKIAVVLDDGVRDIASELLLGSTVVERGSARALTRVEDRVIAFAVGRLLAGLSESLAPMAHVSCERDALAEAYGLLSLGQKSSVLVAARFRLQLLDQHGDIAIAVPRSAFDPYRAELSRIPGAEGKGADEGWSDNLYNNVVGTEVEVAVKIDSRDFTLGDIARLKTGDVLRLPVAPTSPLRVVSEGRTLFWCTLGQKDGNYTVRLEEFSDGRQSFIQDILGA